MRAIPLFIVAALAAPAAADPTLQLATDPAEKDPRVLRLMEPPRKRDVKEPRNDLVSVIRNFKEHVTAWSQNPIPVSLGMLLGVDNVAILRLRFDVGR